MSDPDNSPSDSSAPPVGVAHPENMEEAIEMFMADGYDSVEHILRVFAHGDAPEEVKDPILRVFGRYLHVFREAFIFGLNMEACHVTATNAVMGDPVVTNMIEGFMNVGVEQVVARAVE